MTKTKKSSKHQEEQLDHQKEQLDHQKEQLEPVSLATQLEHQEEQLEPVSLATFAIMMALEARVMSLVNVLFPLLDRIEAGERITDKEILEKLSSVKVGNKTALEKLESLRKQQ